MSSAQLSKLVALHEKTKGHDWEFTFAEQNPKFPSKIKMPKNGKGPLAVPGARLCEK